MILKQALTTHGWDELELEKTLHIICKCLYFSVSHNFQFILQIHEVSRIVIACLSD